jgi:peptidoglycan/LPS O-acetylase OafA/YrhL
LEIGRFIAASTVVFAHLTGGVDGYAALPVHPIFDGLGRAGALGVQYFFVLSGFVMVSAHYNDFGKPGATLKFWWRRACRIYPSYWLALIIPIYYLHGFLTPSFSAQLFTLSPWHISDFIAPAWSLRYEMAFYMIFGLCLLPYVGKPLFALWVGLCVWRWVPGHMLHVLHLPPPFLLARLAKEGGDHFLSFFDYYFFAGAAAGAILMRFSPGRRTSAALLVGGAVLLLLSLPQIKYGDSYGDPMTVLVEAGFIATLMLGLAGLERHGIIRLGKTAARLGAMSYPLYILHTVFLLWAWNELPRPKLSPGGEYVVFFLAVVAIYGASALATFYFDQPVQRVLRRLRWPRRRPIIDNAQPAAQSR